MKSDFTVKGKVRITVLNNIKNIPDELPIEMTGVAVILAATHLFEVNESVGS